MRTIALAILLFTMLSACHALSPRITRDEAAWHARLLLEKSEAAVVDIIATSTYQPDKEPSFRWLDRIFPNVRALSDLDQSAALHKLGTGIVIREDGLILVNAHVVSDADDINVRLATRDVHAATVVGIDRSTDIALLKIDAAGLAPAALGRSERVRVGDWVAALGASDGFPETVTAGVVTAKARKLDDSTILFIQTDMAVRRTNTGGPLVNVRGEIVGLSSHIYGRGIDGVHSFAIPIEAALDIARQLQSQSKFQNDRVVRYSKGRQSSSM